MQQDEDSRKVGLRDAPIEFPRLDHTVLRRFLEQLVRVGFLRPPGGRDATGEAA